MILHAGLVALRLGGYWRGALILGASGAGKSDLALRALDAGFRLVADDRVAVWTSGGALYGRAPEPICDLIEARGHGVVAEPALAFAEIVLAAECAGGAEIERMPEPQRFKTAGAELPLVTIDPFEASAPAKLRRALQHLGAAPQQGYQAASCGGGDRLGDRGNPLRPRR
jgi:serine kinase of HPr protein (carbohydrate metabolism regulator)